MSASLVIEVHWGGYPYQATFQGPRAEDIALKFLADRPGHKFAPIEGHDIDVEAFPRIVEAIWPVCHHGMSADLCMDPVGPHHFGTAEWERQHYGDW